MPMGLSLATDKAELSLLGRVANSDERYMVVLRLKKLRLGCRSIAGPSALMDRGRDFNPADHDFIGLVGKVSHTVSGTGSRFRPLRG